MLYPNESKTSKKKPEKRGPKKIVWNYKKIEQLAAMGLTKTDIGRALGYEKSSFFAAKAEDDEIEAAIVRGRAKFKVIVSRNLVKQMTNGNVTAAIWLDKTRCGTKEDQGQDDEQNNAQPVQVIIRVEDASNRSNSE